MTHQSSSTAIPHVIQLVPNATRLTARYPADIMRSDLNIGPFLSVSCVKLEFTVDSLEPETFAALCKIPPGCFLASSS